MRTVVLNAVLCTGSVVANIALTRPAEPAHAVAPKPAEKLDWSFQSPAQRVVAREIVLVDEDGKPRITILAGKGGSGIWIGDHGGAGGNGGVISMYNVPGQGAVLGFYSREGGRIGDACDFAVAENGGKVSIQYRKADGGLDWFDPADLKK